MPRVKVKYFASLRELLGNTKEEEYKAKDRTMLMDLLLKHIPERHRNISRSWKGGCLKKKTAMVEKVVLKHDIFYLRI